MALSFPGIFSDRSDQIRHKASAVTSIPYFIKGEGVEALSGSFSYMTSDELTSVEIYM